MFGGEVGERECDIRGTFILEDSPNFQDQERGRKEEGVVPN